MINYMETITLAMVVNKNLEKISGYDPIRRAKPPPVAPLKTNSIKDKLLSKIKDKQIANSAFTWATQLKNK